MTENNISNMSGRMKSRWIRD